MVAKQVDEATLSYSKMAGDFGEHLVGVILAKSGIAVAHAPMEGFDLIALDKKGVFLTKERLVGISVKTRLQRDNYISADVIDIGADQANKAAQIWQAEPWLAVVCGSIGYTLEVFLLPYSESSNFRGKTRSGGLVSVTALRNDTSGTARKLMSEPRFVAQEWLSVPDMQERLTNSAKS
jgi:hypothetical protein